MTRLATLCLLLAGCIDSSTETSETDQHVEVANGVSLNGVSLNGVSLNGVSLNGVSLNGVSLNGVSLNGTELTIASVGAELVATLSNGATVQLRIDGATAIGTQWSYDVSYETILGRQRLCEAGALAVPGTWNTERGIPGGGAYTASTDSFTFACRGKTIAKCVELGYTTDKIDHLQSCVRLLRGDFCGDGTPYTADGTMLNLYDRIGVQADTNGWMVEGEWSPDGAVCISKPRYTRFSQVLGLKPPCALEKLEDDCGTFANGGLLVDELP